MFKENFKMKESLLYRRASSPYMFLMPTDNIFVTPFRKKRQTGAERREKTPPFSDRCLCAHVVDLVSVLRFL